VTIATWEALESALVPIIGQGGFVALYQRCLHLAMPDHPWLSAAADISERGAGFEPLLQALSQQPPERAAAAHEHLLRSFLDILANLIGPSLVQRLLGSAVVVPPSDPPEQDALP
jgi:hypothetical protein